jgi:hypothetical protein
VDEISGRLSKILTKFKLVMMLSHDSNNHGILKWIAEGVRFVTPRQTEALRQKDRKLTRLWKALSTEGVILSGIKTG